MHAERLINKIDVFTDRHDDAMAFALDAPAGGETSMVTVPIKPTAAMLAAGARAGDVSVEAAWRVFQAMVQQTG